MKSLSEIKDQSPRVVGNPPLADKKQPVRLRLGLFFVLYYIVVMINPILKTRLIQILGRILIYLIVLYVFFILGKAIWINWQLKKQMEQIEKEIAIIQQQNKDLENLILYYKSDSFREVESRKKLGLKKPGEMAVPVPTKTFDNFQQETEAQKEGVSEITKEEKTSNWRLWWQFLIR